MKKLFLSIAMITFLAGTVSVSFGQELNKQQDKAKEPVKSENPAVTLPEQQSVETQLDSVADYKKLTKASELRFIENEKAIAGLKLNNKSMDETEKSAKSKEIDLLEQKNISLKKELSSYQENRKAGWKDFNNQFNQDMDKLTQDLKTIKDGAK